MEQITISIGGKVSDMFDMQVRVNGKKIRDYDGYVPDGIGIGGGDYIEFDIDAKTGQILNWKTLTLEDINSALEEAR